MKKLQLIALALLVSIGFISCDQDESKVEPPTAEELIARTWVLKSISVQENNTEVDDVSEYDNLAIRFVYHEDGNTYTVENASHAFTVASGTWRWANEEIKRDIILTEEGIDLYLTVNEIQADLLEITFEREGEIIVSGGRSMVIPDRVFIITLQNL